MARKRKFKDGDEIKIINGRNKNCIGTLTEYIDDYGHYTGTARVKVICSDGDIENMVTEIRNIEKR